MVGRNLQGPGIRALPPMWRVGFASRHPGRLRQGTVVMSNFGLTPSSPRGIGGRTHFLGRNPWTDSI